LKLTYDKLLSAVAFNCNLRPCIKDPLLLQSMESDARGGQDTGVGMPSAGPARGVGGLH